MKKSAEQLRREADKLTQEAERQEAARAVEQDAADKAAFLARRTEKQAEQAAVLQDYADTEAAIVAVVVELDGLCKALVERRKQCAAVHAVPPNTFADGLERSIRGQLTAWATFRPELVGHPAKPDPRIAALSEARSEVARAQEMLDEYQGKLNAFQGSPTSPDRARLLGLARDWAEALQRNRARLAAVLASCEQTADIRRERLDLADAQSERQTITVPV